MSALASSTSSWMDGTVALSLERSVTQVALSIDEPATRPFLELIDEQRKPSDSLFDKAIGLINEQSYLETQSAFLAAIHQGRETVARLRSEVDQMLSMPASSRDRGRTYDLPLELKAEIAGMKNAIEFLRVENELTSNTAAVLYAIQNRAWEVREFGGRARTYYAIATLGGNGQVKDGVQLVNQAGEALTDIVGSIGKVVGIVEEISSASQEQATGVQEINSSVTNLDEMTQQNSALVEESSAAAGALNDQAGKLGELMMFFKVDGSMAPARRQSTVSPRQAERNPARLTPKVKAKQQPANAPAMAAAGDNDWNEF